MFYFLELSVYTEYECTWLLESDKKFNNVSEYELYIQEVMDKVSDDYENISLGEVEKYRDGYYGWFINNLRNRLKDDGFRFVDVLGVGVDCYEPCTYVMG